MFHKWLHYNIITGQDEIKKFILITKTIIFEQFFLSQAYSDWMSSEKIAYVNSVSSEIWIKLSFSNRKSLVPVLHFWMRSTHLESPLIIFWHRLSKNKTKKGLTLVTRCSLSFGGTLSLFMTIGWAGNLMQLSPSTPCRIGHGADITWHHSTVSSRNTHEWIFQIPWNSERNFGDLDLYLIPKSH